MKARPLTVRTVVGWAIGLAGFLGACAVLKGYAQQATGWLASPTIDKAQAKGLAHFDSIQAARDARMEASNTRIEAKVDANTIRLQRLSEIVIEMPEAKAAAKRLGQKDRERERLLGSRGIADDRTTFRALKGDRIP